MGSGRTLVGASFRPEIKGPDFALAASIENTHMPALNELLRAYGKLDVVQGFFSVYTEMRVRNRKHGHDVLYLFGELSRLANDLPTQLMATATRD
jgi:hypothetical protein